MPAITLRRMLLAVAVAASAAACGDDTEGSASSADTTPDTDDTGADTESDTGADTAPDTGADTAPDTDDSDTGADTTPVACPDSISCLDERSGRPRLAICGDADFPDGTTCTASASVEGEFCCTRPFACATDADCEANRVELEFCVDDRFPCVCLVETGKCVTDVCTSSADCDAGLECLGGRCQEGADATTLVARMVTPDSYLAAGTGRQLWAVAVDPDDPEVTSLEAPLTWSIDSGTGAVSASGAFTGAGSGVTVVRVKVASNPADPGDTVTISGLADDAAGPRVTVVDESSRAPLADVPVLLVANGESRVERTGSDGTATFAGAGAPPYDIHTFADGHAYVSVMGAAGAHTLVSAPPETFAEIQEIRDGYICPVDDPEVPAIIDTSGCGEVGQPPCICYQVENVDVVKGVPSFEQVANEGELGVSINGFALGNSLLDLNFDLIVGPSIDRVFPDGSPIQLDSAASIPSGVTLYFNGRPLVDSFIATAPPGRRTLWSVGGVISLSRNPNLLPSLIQQIGGDTSDIGSIIAVVLPLLQDFYSGVRTGVELSDSATCCPVRDPGIVLDVPTQQRMTISLPSLDDISTVRPDTVIVLGGALVPGEGFVPLGITAGADKVRSSDTPDGLIDGDPENGGPSDPLTLTLAPIHGGIQTPGTRYMVATVALRLGRGEGGPRELSSGRVDVFDLDELPTNLDLSGAPFADTAGNPTWDEASRRVSFTPSARAGDITRVVFKGSRDRAWIVYQAGGSTIDLPAPFEGLPFEDRTEDGRFTVVGIDLREADGVSYQQLAAMQGATFTELFEHVGAFSILSP